jgi:TrpR family transcriptional regulator, trp operon repressor
VKRVINEISEMLVSIKDTDEMKKLLGELFTKKELDTLALRWCLLKDLFDGMPQRKIAERYSISLCKITRGTKVLKKRNGAVKGILKQKNLNGADNEYKNKREQSS